MLGAGEPGSGGRLVQAALPFDGDSRGVPTAAV